MTTPSIVQRIVNDHVVCKFTDRMSLLLALTALSKANILWRNGSIIRPEMDLQMLMGTTDKTVYLLNKSLTDRVPGDINSNVSCLTWSCDSERYDRKVPKQTKSGRTTKQTAKQYRNRFNFDYSNQLYALIIPEQNLHLLEHNGSVLNVLACCEEEALDKFREMKVPAQYLTKQNVIKISVHSGRTSLHYLTSI